MTSQVNYSQAFFGGNWGTWEDSWLPTSMWRRAPGLGFFFKTSTESLPTNGQFSTWSDAPGLDESPASHAGPHREQQTFRKAPQDVGVAAPGLLPRTSGVERPQ